MAAVEESQDLGVARKREVDCSNGKELRYVVVVGSRQSNVQIIAREKIRSS